MSIPHYTAAPAPAFTLIEMAIVLAVIGLAAALFLGTSNSILDNERRKNVRVRLDAVETAMVNFVAINKRLPCPADGRIASGAAGAGAEQRNAVTGICTVAVAAHGVVPWVALGLAEGDAIDTWNTRLTYRVDPNLAAGAPLPLLMNMTECDPAAVGAVTGTGACQVPAALTKCVGSAACTSPAAYLSGKGLDVWDGGASGFNARQNNASAGSGAAWVILSHGPSGAGAYHSSGMLQPGTVPLSKDLEERNANGLALAKPATALNVYIDAPVNDNPQLLVQPPPPPVLPPRTQFHFDDYVSHPTLISVLMRANLGPRAH